MIRFKIPFSKKFKFFSTFASKSLSVKLPLSTAPPITTNFPLIIDAKLVILKHSIALYFPQHVHYVQ